MFLVKLAFRLIHITAGSILIGTTFADAIWSSPRASNYALVQGIAGGLLLVSGILNAIFLAPEKTMGNLKKSWLSLIYFKFFLWVLLLPIPEILAKKFGFAFPRKTVNQGIVVVYLLTSSYAKQYRDWAVLQKQSKN